MVRARLRALLQVDAYEALHFVRCRKMLINKEIGHDNNR